MAEINPITAADVQLREEIEVRVYWTEPGLYITRLRLLTDPGFPLYDVSYCHGRLRDGTAVDVQLPFGQLTKGRWKTEIVKYAKQDGVFAKGLGVFDNISIFS